MCEPITGDYQSISEKLQVWGDELRKLCAEMDQAFADWHAQVVAGAAAEAVAKEGATGVPIAWWTVRRVKLDNMHSLRGAGKPGDWELVCEARIALAGIVAAYDDWQAVGAELRKNRRADAVYVLAKRIHDAQQDLRAAVSDARALLAAAPPPAPATATIDWEALGRIAWDAASDVIVRKEHFAPDQVTPWSEAPEDLREVYRVIVEAVARAALAAQPTASAPPEPPPAAGPPAGLPATATVDEPTGGYRDVLGRIVRDTWIVRCYETGDTKPSHLAPWQEMNETDRETDRRIAEAVARAVLAS